MEVFIIVSLILAGLLLFIVEVFLIPGISIAGIASAICLLYANYYAFDTLGPIAGFITLIASVLSCIAIIVWFMHSKTMDKLYAGFGKIKGGIFRKHGQYSTDILVVYHTYYNV